MVKVLEDLKNAGEPGMLANGNKEDVKEQPAFGRLNLAEIAASFPETAETLLVDAYLQDEAAVSVRLFRVYRETPPHYHAHCDEHLYVFSGRGTFWMESPDHGGEFAPGDFLFFKRRTVHAFPEIFEWPVLFLAFDTPRRDPKDIVFVNPDVGTPESFIHKLEKGSRDRERI